MRGTAGIVISDTAPIRALAALDGLTWLHELFAEVVSKPERHYAMPNRSAWPRTVDPLLFHVIATNEGGQQRRRSFLRLQSGIRLG